MQGPLKLRADTREDLEIISACMQDMTVKIADLAFLPRQHRLAFVGNRFRWELPEPPGDANFNQPSQRIRSAFRVENVLRVSSRDLPREDSDAVLGLLSLELREEEDLAVSITLHFYGGGAMRLSCECLEVYMEDISRPWPTAHRPQHDIDAPDAIDKGSGS